MKRTKEIGEKLLKYAEERFPETSNMTKERTKQLRQYVRDMGDVSRELMYSSTLMAGHKKIFVDPSPEA